MKWFIVESFIICKYVIIGIINCPTKDLYELFDNVNDLGSHQIREKKTLVGEQKVKFLKNDFYSVF